MVLNLPFTSVRMGTYSGTAMPADVTGVTLPISNTAIGVGVGISRRHGLGGGTERLARSIATRVSGHENASTTVTTSPLEISMRQSEKTAGQLLRNYSESSLSVAQNSLDWSLRAGIGKTAMTNCSDVFAHLNLVIAVLPIVRNV